MPIEVRRGTGEGGRGEPLRLLFGEKALPFSLSSFPFTIKNILVISHSPEVKQQ